MRYKMKQNKLIGPLLLIIAAFIWGSAFVAQSEGAKHLGPFTFLCLRSFLGTAVLLPVIFVTDMNKKKRGTLIKSTKKDIRALVIGGITCGIVLFGASACQQIGLDKGTEPGKAGFITALYILLVPVFSLFLGKKIRPIIWGCVGISIIALYLLCVKEDNTIVPADLFVLLCAALYAVHILVIDKVAPDIDGVKRRTRATMGRCQGGFCMPYIVNLLSEELGIPVEQVTKCGGASVINFSKTKEVGAND